MIKRKNVAKNLGALWIVFAIATQSILINFNGDLAYATGEKAAASAQIATPDAQSAPQPKRDIIADSRGLPRVRLPGSNNETLFPLNEESYVRFKVRRLKNARVGWVNWALLREMGYEVPREGMTPKFEKTLLDAWAYVVPAPEIPSEHFTNVELTHYADRYGGSGGDAGGSGRAGGEGLYQNKGSGRTPIAGPSPEGSLLSAWSWNPFTLFKNMKTYLSNKHHSHGGATLREGLAEASWAEILHREPRHFVNHSYCV